MIDSEQYLTIKLFINSDAILNRDALWSMLIGL